ncbi:TetR family transcriptional regulator [Pilimelia anulata]|uniref:TetR family transcriptional regulator n=1 Tax=Pilimelia anulata TaxID=53371 RepID=A0A8J3BG55_9ACTN|nr:TetR/AcrR family transcriptional regulator [Pilimelia anulata]GGK01334.1 TetR family transcriptional regulator [Pilimelia anulata]
MRERPGDTRSRIRDVALDLFAEQGYEQTALREIAERLGVTKAALYYHFKSKDEIVESVLADRLRFLDELIAYGRQREPDRELRRDVLARYAEGLRQPANRRLMRFFERNQPALRSSPSAARLKERMRDLVRVICGPDAGPEAEMRTGLALFAAHAAAHWLSTELDEEERLRVALAVGNELLDRT